MRLLQPRSRVLPLLAMLAWGCPNPRAAAQSPALQSRELPHRPVADPIRPSPHRPWTLNSSSGATTTALELSATTADAGTAVTLTARVTSGKTAVAPGIVLF